MARTTGTASLADLLEHEVLRHGEPIEIRRRSALPIQGVIQAGGKIKVGTTVSDSPSKAARLALTAGSVDGWLRWRVPRLGGKSLAEIREGAQAHEIRRS
jgi:hypothetical protein